MTTGSIGIQKNMKWALSVALPAALYILLPESAVITPKVRMFLAITSWAVLMFCFELLDNAITALSLSIAYAITEILPFGKAFGGWSGTVVWQCFGIFIFINMMKRTSVLKRFAYTVLSVTGGSYMGILMGLTIFAVCFHNFAFAGLALAYGIVEVLELGRSRAAAGILLSMAMAFGDARNFLYYPSGVGISGAAANTVTEVAVNYITTLQHNIPWIAFPFLMTFIIGKLMSPEKALNGKAYFMEEKKKLGPMSADEKKVVSIFLLMMLYMFTTSIHGMSMVYGFIIFPLLLYLPGLDVGTKDDIAKVNLPLLIFISGCISIGTAAAAVGAGQIVSDVFTPVMAGQSNYVFAGLVFLAGYVANIFMTPVALMNLLTPPFTQISLDMGITAYPVIYLLKHASTHVLFPFENTTILFAYSFGAISMGNFVKCFLVKLAVYLAFLFLVSVPFWSFCGLM